jgi:hypothetical protein
MSTQAEVLAELGEGYVAIEVSRASLYSIPEVSSQSLDGECAVETCSHHRKAGDLVGGDDE